jgi:hypothetical protein
MWSSALAAIALLLSPILACQTAFDFGFSSCTFFVNYTDTSCTNFVLDRCEFEVSDDQAPIPPPPLIHSDLRLLQLLTVRDWANCTQICCDSSVDYPMNTDSIESCQSYLNQSIYKIIIIVCSIVGGFYLCLLTCALCTMCVRQRGDRRSRFCSCFPCHREREHSNSSKNSER